MTIKGKYTGVFRVTVELEYEGVDYNNKPTLQFKEISKFLTPEDISIEYGSCSQFFATESDDEDTKQDR